MKENISDETIGLSFINEIRPVTFQWKKEKDVPTEHKDYVKDSEKRVMLAGDEYYHGFVAQEVKTVIDNHAEIKDGFRMWKEDSEGRQELGSGYLMPIMVKAVQELSARLKELEK